MGGRAVRDRLGTYDGVFVASALLRFTAALILATIAVRPRRVAA